MTGSGAVSTKKRRSGHMGVKHRRTKGGGCFLGVNTWRFKEKNDGGGKTPNSFGSWVRYVMGHLITRKKKKKQVTRQTNKEEV